jgi:DNA-binding CsgD family transcriptional regulator
VGDGEVFGREDELATVAEFVREAAALPAALVIVGDAGIGKTTLWREAVACAELCSLRVLSCSPAEAETSLSFAGMTDLLDDVLDDVLPDLPSPQATALEVALRRLEPEQPPDQLAVRSGFLNALRVLSKRSALMVGVDDVQWLDDPSTLALAFALRRLRDERVMFVVARRGEATDERPLGFDRARRELRVERLEVEPLSLGAVHSLLRSRLGSPFPRPVLRKIHEVSGGNPFYALELARALRGREIELGLARQLPVPSSLTGLVRDRLGHLSPETRRVLLIASALAQPTFEVLERVIGGERLASALDETVGAGVIELAEGRVRFVHPLLASACYGEATPPQRRDVHRRLAAAVADAEEQSRHLALGAEGPDEAVAEALEHAATDAAKRGAPQAAAELVELSIALTPPDRHDSLLRRRILAGDHHLSCGDLVRARVRFEQAAGTMSRGPDRASVLVRLAETRKDDVEAAIAICEQVLVETADEPGELARVHHLLAYLSSGHGDSRRSLEHARAARDFAERTGDPSVLAIALTRTAGHEYRAGRSAVALPLLERARALEPRGPPLPVYWGPEVQLARILGFQGRIDESRAKFASLLELVAANGDERSKIRVLYYLAEHEWRTGKFNEAARHATDAAELAEQIGLGPDGWGALYHKAAAEAHLGRVDEARADAERILSVAEETKTYEGRIEGRSVLGFLELSLGNLDAADGYLRTVPEMKLAQGWRAPSMSPVWENAIETMIGVGAFEDALTHHARYEELAREYENPWALATAGRCEGMLRSAGGDITAAFDAFERALGEHERAGSPFEEARTLLAYGSVLRRAKRRRAARERLEQALAAFVRLGTPLWAEKAHAELARIGGRARSSDLTESERRIAALVAEGRSNKEVAAALFVTPKTVETRLSRMYAKLGIHSRTELARRVLDEQRVGLS